jgi:hypothetical protein
VIGNWCNLGAGTTCSNLKNNASDVKVKIASDRSPQISGLKTGMIMGDYSRSAINTSFNCGSVVGVSCNIFGHTTQIPFFNHFTWGTDERYQPEKAIADIKKWMGMKQMCLSSEQQNNIQKIYQQEYNNT